jgi:hypothetical protein
MRANDNWVSAQVEMASNTGRVEVYCCMQLACCFHCRNGYCTEVLYFSKIYDGISLYNPVLNDDFIALNLEAISPTMLI